MYFIGNEPNLKGTLGLPQYFHLVEQMSEIRNEECFHSNYSKPQSVHIEEWKKYNNYIHVNESEYTRKYDKNETFTCFHPISIPLADIKLSTIKQLLSLLVPLEKKYPKAVDIWSFQLYRVRK